MGLQLLWSRAFTTLEIDHFRAPKSSKIFSARGIPPPPPAAANLFDVSLGFRHL